jgi:hypothetical protein
MNLPHMFRGETRNTAWWDTAAAVHIQSKLASIWEVFGLIGGAPVALMSPQGGTGLVTQMMQ